MQAHKVSQPAGHLRMRLAAAAMANSDAEPATARLHDSRVRSTSMLVTPLPPNPTPAGDADMKWTILEISGRTGH